ncbi:T9SS type A sorting domain-containing protein [Flavobacterium sp. RHBU_3]|uniref:T9SS type A sorting domain-containing protein n=1 Tax=Flavobacterium sp. RHBU_3 TaxID=3391184 RepID=UPI0039851E24
MRKKLSCLKALCAFILLFVCLKSSAQINYTQNFDGETIGWYDPYYDFFTDSEDGCDGTSMAANLYWYYNYEMSAYSDVIGLSNGQLATLSYSYKLVDYSTGGAYPNTPDWGSFTVQYGTSVDGPWTDIETVSAANHTVSASCAVRTVQFTPTAGANIYLRVSAEVNDDNAIDALVYFDNVQVLQAASPACAGTPDVATPIASTSVSCHGGTVNLSLSPVYLVGGLSFQWQSSANGTDFADIAEATSATYTATVNETLWYRAIVTCIASEESVTTTGVQVTDTGLPCYCDVDFYNGVEPITRVQFAGIDNTSTADTSADGVEVFTDLAPAEVTAGQTYTITIEGTTEGQFSDYFTVFIDFNKNGEFNDDGEVFEIEGSLFGSTGTDGQQVTADITIPTTAEEGITVMRVFKTYLYSTEDPCDASDGVGYGQVEDYLVNISAMVCNLAAPEAAAEQSFCGDALINELTVVATGDAEIVWYATAEGTDELDPFSEIVSGTTYYAAQVEGECESTRTAITATITVTSAPEAAAEQSFCGDALINELTVIATGNAEIVWYATADGTDELDPFSEIVSGTVYYAAQVVGECESARVAITATINVTPEPEGDDEQEFTVFTNEGLPISQVAVEVAEGATLIWYATEEDAENGTNPLPQGYMIAESGTYYAVQVIDGCYSEPLDIDVTLAVLGVDEFGNNGFSCYPNPATDVLNFSGKQNISSVAIHNLLGQKVTEFTNINATTTKVDVSSLPAGTYLVKAAGQNGATATFKVIKK